MAVHRFEVFEECRYGSTGLWSAASNLDRDSRSGAYGQFAGSFPSRGARSAALLRAPACGRCWSARRRCGRRGCAGTTGARRSCCCSIWRRGFCMALWRWTRGRRVRLHVLRVRGQQGGDWRCICRGPQDDERRGRGALAADARCWSCCGIRREWTAWSRSFCCSTRVSLRTFCRGRSSRCTRGCFWSAILQGAPCGGEAATRGAGDWASGRSWSWRSGRRNRLSGGGRADLCVLCGPLRRGDQRPVPLIARVTAVSAQHCAVSRMWHL